MSDDFEDALDGEEFLREREAKAAKRSAMFPFVPLDKRPKACPAAHTHPMISSSVKSGAVMRVAHQLVAICANRLPGRDATFAWQDKLDDVHRGDGVTYCDIQAAPRDGRAKVLLPQALLWLPAPHRLGVLAHAIGHLLCGHAGCQQALKEPEHAADAAAAQWILPGLAGAKSLQRDSRWQPLGARDEFSGLGCPSVVSIREARSVACPTEV
jgi:hypothetical protein